MRDSVSFAADTFASRVGISGGVSFTLQSVL